MKYLLLLSLFPMTLQAQDCKVNKETDPFTKETKLSTGFIPWKDASVTIDADSKEIDLFFTLNGTDLCFDNNGTVALFFEGTKVKQTYRNGGTMNCEGLFHIIFRNSATAQAGIQKLTTTKVTALLFTGNNKKETRIELNAEQQVIFMKVAGCLLEEAKAIVK